MLNCWKILGFAGSLRRDSYNKALLMAAFEVVQEGEEGGVVKSGNILFRPSFCEENSFL
jgi:NAD(P)H-dependent FMN reductase